MPKTIPDPLGLALKDYWNGYTDAKITVHSSITEGEFIPVEYFFRDQTTLLELEQVALSHCRERVLDIGAGAGSHALILQERGLSVTALDLSPLAVNTMQERGVTETRCINAFDFKEGKYDTILLLMNGIGIAGTLDGLDKLLQHLQTLLQPGGQILCDSTDILYIFQEEDGSVWIDLNGDYYGQVTYQMAYEGITGEAFNWLFVSFEILEDHAQAAGFTCELLFTDENDQYLARLALRE